MPLPSIKKPKTAFNFFSDALRPTAKQNHPYADQKVGGWRGGGVGMRWRRELASGRVGGWVGGLLDGKPSAVPLLCLSTHRPHPSLCAAQGVSKIVGDMWADLSAQDREQYNDLTQQDKMRYEKDLQEYYYQHPLVSLADGSACLHASCGGACHTAGGLSVGEEGVAAELPACLPLKQGACVRLCLQGNRRERLPRAAAAAAQAAVSEQSEPPPPLLLPSQPPLQRQASAKQGAHARKSVATNAVALPWLPTHGSLEAARSWQPISSPSGQQLVSADTAAVLLPRWPSMGGGLADSGGGGGGPVLVEQESATGIGQAAPQQQAVPLARSRKHPVAVDGSGQQVSLQMLLQTLQGTQMQQAQQMAQREQQVQHARKVQQEQEAQQPQLQAQRAQDTAQMRALELMQHSINRRMWGRQEQQQSGGGGGPAAALASMGTARSQAAAVGGTGPPAAPAAAAGETAPEGMAPEVAQLYSLLVNLANPELQQQQLQQ